MRRILAIGALVLVTASTLSAQEEPRPQVQVSGARVTATFKDVPLDEVLAFLGEKAHTAVRVDPEAKAEGRPVGRCKVSLVFDRMPVREAILRAAAEFGLNVAWGDGLALLSFRQLPDVTWPALSEPLAAMADGRTASFVLRETPLADSISSLSRQTGAPITCEPGLAKRPVTLAIDKLTARGALTYIAMTCGLAIDVQGGALFVTWPPRERRLQKQLDETLVLFEFNEQPVMEALDFLQTLGKLNIVPDRSRFADPATTVTLKVQNAPLREALEKLTKQLGLVFVVRDGVVVITDEKGAKPNDGPREERVFAADRPTDADRKALVTLDETVVTFLFNEQPYLEAFDFLQTLGKVNITMDRRAIKDPNTTVTLKLQNVPMRTAVKLCAEQLGLTWVIRDGVVFLSDEARVKQLIGAVHRDFAADKPTPADRKVLVTLDEAVVSFTFNEQPYIEAFDFLQTLGKVNIVLDRRAIKEVAATLTLKLDNVPLRTAVKLAAEQLGLRMVIREGVVFLSDEARVKKLIGAVHRDFAAEKPTAADLECAAMLDTRVSFTFNDQPLMGAINYLQTLGKTGIRIAATKLADPKTTVTLKLENVPLRAAVTLLSEQLDLDWIIRDGAVIVSDPANLRKLVAR